MPDSNLMIRQINTRFKIFSMSLLVTNIVSLLTFVLTNIFSKNSNTSDLLILLTLLNSLIFFVAIITCTVFGAMLIHGIFTFLEQKNGSKTDPTFATWTLFIPFFGSVKNPIDLIQANKLLKIDSHWGKYNLYLGIFGAVCFVPYVFLSIYLSIMYPYPNSISSISVGTDYNYYSTPRFSLEVLAVVVGLIMSFVSWKTLQEITKNINLTDVNESDIALEQN